MQKTQAARRDALWSGAYGLATAVATFEAGYYLADAALLGMAAIAWRSGRRPGWHALLAVPVVLGAIWAPVPWVTLTFALRVALLLLVAPFVRARRWDGQMFLWGLTAGLAVQSLLLLRLVGEFRPAALSLNASQVGQTGLMLFLLTPAWRPHMWTLASAGLHLAVAGARASLGALALWGLLAPARWRTAAVVCTLAAALAIAAANPASWAHLVSPATGGVRIENAVGVAPGTEPPPESRRAVLEAYGANAPEWRLPRFSWHGYGLGQYVQSTGLVRPHNIFLLGAYEMGVFFLIPVGALAWAVATRRFPWRVALVLLALWQLVEEPIGRPEGFYVTAAVLAFHWRPRCATS